VDHRLEVLGGLVPEVVVAQQTGGVADHVRTGIGYLGYVAMQAALVMAIASVAMGVLVVSAIIALFSICTGAFNAP